MLGHSRKIVNNSLDLEYVGVKVPMFSFSRLHGADPMLGVEMASTGEVGCLGADLHEALLHGMLATGFRFPSRGVLLSLGPWEDKFWFADEARVIADELRLRLSLKHVVRGLQLLCQLGNRAILALQLPFQSLVLSQRLVYANLCNFIVNR
jgi:hypothetical protein